MKWRLVFHQGDRGKGLITFQKWTDGWLTPPDVQPVCLGHPTGLLQPSGKTMEMEMADSV